MMSAGRAQSTYWPEPRTQIKTEFRICLDARYKTETVVGHSYLYNGNSFTGKMVPLH